MMSPEENMFHILFYIFGIKYKNKPETAIQNLTDALDTGVLILKYQTTILQRCNDSETETETVTQMSWLVTREDTAIIPNLPPSATSTVELSLLLLLF